MEIIEFRDEHTSSWDRFVYQQEKATFFHLTGWKRVVEGVFRHRSRYLLAQERGEITGILPLFLIKSRLFGKFLVSVPFAVYGGICALHDDARAGLLERAKEIAQEQEVDYLELRNLRPDPSTLSLNDLYVTFMKPLPSDPAQCLRELPRKARAAARQSVEYGLKCEVSLGRLKEHHHLNAIQMRRLGSPALPFSWFQSLAQEFKDQSTILSVKYRGKLVASVFVFLFRDAVLPYYSGSLQEYNRYHTSNFMYLKLMEFGVENGYKIFDFGRSRKGTGPYSFKKNQGFDSRPLFYQYYLNRVTQIPNVTPSNPKFDYPKRIWQKMPLPVTKWLGPKLVRAIP
jgi:FemAB-related protein (PEP-CTERM system-associated)